MAKEIKEKRVMKKASLSIFIFGLCAAISVDAVSGESLGTEKEIEKTIKSFQLTKQDCNSKYLGYILDKIESLQEAGKISQDRSLELSLIVIKQMSECKKNKLLHIN